MLCRCLVWLLYWYLAEVPYDYKYNLALNIVSHAWQMAVLQYIALHLFFVCEITKPIMI